MYVDLKIKFNRWHYLLSSEGHKGDGLTGSLGVYRKYANVRPGDDWPLPNSVMVFVVSRVESQKNTHFTERKWVLGWKKRLWQHCHPDSHHHTQLSCSVFSKPKTGLEEKDSIRNSGQGLQHLGVKNRTVLALNPNLFIACFEGLINTSIGGYFVVKLQRRFARFFSHAFLPGTYSKMNASPGREGASISNWWRELFLRDKYSNLTPSALCPLKHSPLPGKNRTVFPHQTAIRTVHSDNLGTTISPWLLRANSTKSTCSRAQHPHWLAEKRNVSCRQKKGPISTLPPASNNLVAGRFSIQSFIMNNIGTVIPIKHWHLHSKMDNIADGSNQSSLWNGHAYYTKDILSRKEGLKVISIGRALQYFHSSLCSNT